MLWSARPEEQDQIVDTAIGPAADRSDESSQVGVHVDDFASDKLSYYLHWSASVMASSCSAEGSQCLAIVLTARSTVPRAVDLPPSIVDPASSSVPRGVLLHSFSVYAPVDGQAVSATIAGEDVQVDKYRYRGRQELVPLT